MSVKVELSSIADKTIILSLELGKIGNTRRISSNTEAIQTDVDRSMLNLSVDLFDAPEQRQCQKFLTALRAKINLYTVPSFFRGGMYLVKHEAVEQVDAMIEKAIEDFKPVVTRFADVVDQRRDEARARLKGAFDIKHYPTREQVLAAYRIDKRWLTMSTPDSLKQISAGFFEKERKKAEQSVAVAAEGIVKLLAAEASGLSKHLIERLTPDADGKAKIFRNSAITNITEFLSTFNLRNIGTSEELNAQIEKIQALVNGVDPQVLRDNESLASTVRTGFEQVAAELDRLVVARPVRMMDFSEVK